LAPATKPGFNREWADDGLVFDTEDPAYQHYFPAGFYTTDAFTEKASEFIAEWDTEDSGHPLFLYLAYTAPHDPLLAHEADIAKYEGVYDVGFEAIRNARYQKQQTEGLIANTNQYALSPPTHRDWSGLTQGQRDDQARRMQVYAAMIDRVDQKIGEVIAQLQQIGAFDDTLILLCSDNGSSSQNVSEGDTSAETGSLERWASLQGDWANVGNTPFRYFKTDSDEGGTRTPMIAHWPKGIVNPGRFTDHPGHVMDFMATFLDLSGASYPRRHEGNMVVPLQGESFSDVLFNETPAPRSPLFFQLQDGQAVIDGNYKLIKRSTAAPWRLFDLSVDATELNDIAATETSVYEALLAKYGAWETAVIGNEPPFAVDDTLFGTHGASVAADLLRNDSDDGSVNAASLIITGQPIHGSVSILPDYTIEFTPGSVITRVDRFAYRIADDDGELSNEALVTINFNHAGVSVFETKMEAEGDSIVSAEILDTRPTASGGEFVNFNPNDPADFIEWNVDAPWAGEFDVSFRYAGGYSGNRQLELRINGVLIDSGLAFPGTGSWDDWRLLTLASTMLQSGANTIRVSTLVGNDGPNLDFLNVAGDEGKAGPLDTDLDTLPDWFEDLVPGLDKSDADDAMEDLDGDGESNALEFAAGKDVLDPASSLSARLFLRGTEVLFEWDAVEGEMYDAFQSIDLKNWNHFRTSATGGVWIGGNDVEAFFQLGFDL